ncbi:MAG: glycosyltransferase family 9 protein [Helicobacteraceae bacterium]
MKILVLRNDKLGDFILALPVFYVLKRRYPSARIAAFVSALGEETAQNAEFIDEVITDSGNTFENARAIRSFAPDVSITLFSTFWLGLALFLARVPLRIAPATKLAQIFHNKTKRQKRSSVKMSEFEYNLDLLSALDGGLDLSFPRPLLRLGSSAAFETFCAGLGIKNKRIIGFHVGFGGSSLANLSLEEYLDLARIAHAGGFSACFTFGPNEFELAQKVQDLVRDLGAEQDLTQDAAQDPQDPSRKTPAGFEAFYFLSKSGLVNFAQIISHFACFVATSTGTLQLAGALDIHTFGFFGDTLIASPKRWKPLSALQKQKNYTLPQDAIAREQVIAQIKDDFRAFCRSANA